MSITSLVSDRECVRMCDGGVRNGSIDGQSGSGSDNPKVSDAENDKTCLRLPVASTPLEPRRVPSV
ncbi:hypothetical protein NEUTE1DRAFT_103371 [Neurospora tetrasperma FGSC 2508]|uniref:Uncharacterized protein n=1 Tax=Neurospora tetrasperma (strain FGSC 2508 / ATCC MYA-4615 / P0657) TaxID=510951 RepID=F8MT08_NEUT8|nr:uncharacterized protein NEUTE1DRAFT_103371 [Neurospora tetrasperma FGSC 2508]EGO55990.1 hypothetical protein NEUTE1DRAFT_103371 [Neurospora tetrasperma FGSC 2508]EGZ68745.1 hypothetical protein NEUTE2DRAFT_131168 [Neurospora tetrasperma FGSC 2509]